MELRTTIFPRKMVWEENQINKNKGSNESNWMGQIDLFEDQINKLAKAGIKGGRLVILPFEITKDGKKYDWSPWEEAIGIMEKAGMKVDLAAGPLDYPYGPEGVRLPDYLLALTAEIRQKERINLGIGEGESIIEKKIAEFGLEYFEKLLNRYGRDERVDKIYIGNEWPDRHLIEGAKGSVGFSKKYMMELATMALQLSDKKIALNTNIHPTDIGKIEKYFGEILEALGNRGVLGIDAYPTQENWWQKRNYGKKIEKIREEFAKTQIVFTELQAEPWPGQGWAGRSWKDIFELNFRMIKTYYEKDFDQARRRYAVESGITELGLWGAPIWLLADRMGYKHHWEKIKKYKDGYGKINF